MIIMTRKELINQIAEVSEFSKKDTEKFYVALEESLISALQDGEEEIKLGFATIKVNHQESKERRNPRTGETFMADAKNVAKIKLSAPIKRAVAQ